MMKYFLIEFRYEHYCQGYEWTTEQVLVQASTVEEACKKIIDSGKYYGACEFNDKTLG
jgi:hypothetical protein